MRRRLLTWAFTLPLAVAGTQAAHALTYRLVAPDAGERAILLAGTGHGYLSSALPLGLALCTAIVLVAFAGDLRGRLRGSHGTTVGPGPFTLLAPVVYAAQEIFERLLHDGGVGASVLVEPTFALGLALQLPFALAAYAVATLLLRAARSIARLIIEPDAFVAPLPHRSWSVVPHAVLRASVPALGGGTRGPPPLLVP